MTPDRHDDTEQRADEEARQHARDTRVLMWVLVGAGVFLLLWIAVVLVAFIG